jgi:hypothetical protein
VPRSTYIITTDKLIHRYGYIAFLTLLLALLRQDWARIRVSLSYTNGDEPRRTSHTHASHTLLSTNLIRLPHTDEKYWNRDLGNCLDYTNNFEGNKTPDAYLYNYLKDLYGIVGTNSTGVPVAQSNTNSGTYAPSSNTGGRRLKHRPDGRRHLFESVESEARRRELLFRWNEIDSLVVSGFVGSERDGWRLLHQTAYGEAHEIDLGDNYSVQVHLLLA